MLCSVAAILLVAGCGAADDSDMPDAGSTHLGEYLTLPGDQVVVVPDGTYTGGRISAPHPATDGPWRGWLVLVAQSRGGAIVTGDLVLEADTSRVLFVGFRFVESRVINYGGDLAYWYTDHTFPDADWYEAGRPLPHSFTMNHPARNITVLGSDFHDSVSSPVVLNGVDDIELTGVEVYDVTRQPATAPAEVNHVDLIQLIGGATTDLRVKHSYFQGARINIQTDNGDVVGVTFEDVWYTVAHGSAFQFNATNGNRITARRVNVRSWGHLGTRPRDRRDTVDGVEVPTGSRPDRVEVIDDGIDTTTPPPGVPDPSANWRQQHPYDSWPTYFGWPGAGPDRTDDQRFPTAWYVLALVGTVLSTAAATIAVRRRRRTRRAAARVDRTVVSEQPGRCVDVTTALAVQGTTRARGAMSPAGEKH
jgi:hypothetical protein